MPSKFYVVWKGRETGIFSDWSSCKKQVDQFPGARYKSFKTRQEAEAAFAGKTISGGGSESSQKVTKSSRSAVKTYTGDEIKCMPFFTKIFTDGGCEPNPGNAGSGIAVYQEERIHALWYGLYNPQGTNNTAELNALFEALKIAEHEHQLKHTTAIFCDSKYSIQCITQWAVNWEKNGWKKPSGEIKNLELIQKMYAYYQEIKDSVPIYHVNGHVGVEGNELADRMSILAIDQKCQDFIQYNEPLDVEKLLAMRTG